MLPLEACRSEPRAFGVTSTKSSRESIGASAAAPCPPPTDHERSRDCPAPLDPEARRITQQPLVGHPQPAAVNLEYRHAEGLRSRGLAGKAKAINSGPAATAAVMRLAEDQLLSR